MRRPSDKKRPFHPPPSSFYYLGIAISCFSYIYYLVPRGLPDGDFCVFPHKIEKCLPEQPKNKNQTRTLNQKPKMNYHRANELNEIKTELLGMKKGIDNLNQILAEQKINDYKLYHKSMTEEDKIALKVAEEVFGKNFRIEETVGYINWWKERMWFQGEYLKAITNLNYAMAHQYKGDDDEDYYMTEEGILTENDDDGEMPEDATPDINYFSNANIERITEVITDLLEDEELWDELDHNTKPIVEEEEVIECVKCETEVKSKDMALRDYGHLDVCKKCDQKTQDSVGGSGDKKNCVGCKEDFDIQWLYSRDGVDGLLCEECYDDAMLDADEEEVPGVCYECGLEGKFIGKEGDDWLCADCSSIS